MNTVSCILPAYNEGDRIKTVLDVVTNHPLIHEIIVVDDGSSDDTRTIAALYTQCHLITLPKNGGKSHAVATGIRAATGTVILLLDTDLTGLTPAHISALIEPVTSGTADMTISLRDNAPLLWRMIGLDYISGERAFLTSFIQPLLDNIAALHGFGLEVFINKHIIRQHLRIKVVRISGVQSAFKYHRKSILRFFGVNKDFVRMGLTIMKNITPAEVVRQIYGILRLRV